MTHNVSGAIDDIKKEYMRVYCQLLEESEMAEDIIVGIGKLAIADILRDVLADLSGDPDDWYASELSERWHMTRMQLLDPQNLKHHELLFDLTGYETPQLEKTKQ